ncbi:MAG: DUF4493 domain-containing protein [Muribaculaceae bacterium]|nr:DUF4493 domain-containing protein [Muribaculaceae bacterium]
MKAKFITIAAALLASLGLASCSDAWNADEVAGEGTLTINTIVRGDVKVQSRAATGEDLADKLLIQISNDKGVVRQYKGAADLPASIGLLSGNYILSGWTGDSVPASFDDRYFKGSTAFSITAGKSSSVDLVCKIANVVASVNFDENVAEVLSDYSVTVGHVAGTLTFEGNDTRKGYFMMNSRATDLEYTLTGTKLDGETLVKTGVIPGVKPATEYVLHITYTSNDQEIGGGFFDIEVEDEPLGDNHDVVISMAPTISGLGFNINNTLVREPEAVGRISLFVGASSTLKSVVLDGDYLDDYIEPKGSDFDLMAISDDIRDQMNSKGINFIYTYYPDADNSSMKINFEPTMTDAMPDGYYEFTVTATDENGKTSTGVLKLEINGTPVRVEPLAEGAAWATKATLTGTIRQSGATNVMFNHRERGTQAWTQVAPSSSESRSTFYTAEVTGLKPETDYEYTISCTLADGSEYMSDDIQRFTTGSTPQLPNAGFEEWDTESQKYYLIHAKGGEMFWDCGNQGSSTMSKNVTLPDGDVKHNGQYSAKLASQFVGVGSLGKFAAGNIFIGKYLETLGTNGLLGWGRPFTARPVALKGYVKYSPVAITSEKTDQGYIKGDMDKGIIYIALLDASDVQMDSEYKTKYPDFPVMVNTKSVHLFDKDASNVIAYGEKVFGATSGDAMVEFTIPINYNRTDVIPTYILCTASASKGGDYFAGGNGSTMWIDDLELVY